jgi:Flp pilus assembly pilin Flp
MPERKMMKLLKGFLQEESGQDMVEYTLLLAFVALAAGGLYAGIGTSVLNIWTKAGTDLTNANTAAH